MKSHYNAKNGLLLFILTIIWGSSYILIKKGLLYFNPVELAAIRICFSGMVVLPFIYKAFKSVPPQKLGWVLLIGLTGSGIPAFMFAISVGKLGSSVNGIINSLSPLFTLLIGTLIFKDAIKRNQIFGVLIGLAGALILVAFNNKGQWNLDYKYAILPVIATLCYGSSSNITKHKLSNLNPIYTTSLAMFFIGLPCFLYLLLSGSFETTVLNHQNYKGLTYIFILSVFGTVVAWSLFYKLVQNSDALFAASVTYLIPIVAVLWGLADGETLHIHHLFGMILILTGVYFVSKKTNS